MRFSTKSLLITGLAATQALSKMIPRGFEVRLRDTLSDAAPPAQDSGELDYDPPTEGYDPLNEPATDTSGTVILGPPAYNHTDNDFQWFNLNDSMEISEMPDKKDWVIPVSHAMCQQWDLKDVNARGAVEQIVLWNNRGGKVGHKYVHWEVDGMYAIFVCDCKWQYRDKAPAWEMWEFYERLIEWCGEGRGGWIFSKKWEKGYALSTRDKVVFKEPKKALCPSFCCFNPKAEKFAVD
ncbi:hypothetical protein F4805DRAFT_416200 [Annulohypoxylon moriforme]|nr:hypothetical protein F4805DRAFT_416200 [Annulohypoxylon moriforme]